MARSASDPATRQRNLVGSGLADGDHGGELSRAAIALQEFCPASLGLRVPVSGDRRTFSNGVVFAERQ
jgi:hypothetical protein